MKKCPLISDGVPCFVHLCKFGDQMILLPALREIFLRTGLKPVVLCKSPYHTVYDGVSYADALAVPWTADIARKFAWYMFGNAIVTKWWEASDHYFFDVIESEHRFRLFYKGREFNLDKRVHPNYMLDQWSATGFSPEELMQFPLVFDRRNVVRERELIRNHVHPGKPLFLINFEGGTSPFGAVPEVMQRAYPLLREFQIVDLAQIRATRIYDLLGLYDIAVGLITSDTATLHLAAAAKIPYIAYTNDGWGRSVPRGNCVIEIQYSKAITNLSELEEHLSGIISNDNPRLDKVRIERSANSTEKSDRATNLANTVMA